MILNFLQLIDMHIESHIIHTTLPLSIKRHCYPPRGIRRIRPPTTRSGEGPPPGWCPTRCRPWASCSLIMWPKRAPRRSRVVDPRPSDDLSAAADALILSTAGALHCTAHISIVQQAMLHTSLQNYCAKKPPSPFGQAAALPAW